MSVLFITHDMGVVAEIADRTVVMYRRRGGRDRRRPRTIFARAAASLHARAARRRAAARLDGRADAGRCAFRSSIARRASRTRRPRRPTPSRRPTRPVLEVSGPDDALRHPLRPVRPASRAASMRSRTSRSACSARRDAGAGRRIRLRQVDDRPLRDAADRAARAAPCCSTARTCSKLGPARPARAPQAHADDLPGPVRQPQSAHDDRRRDRRAAADQQARDARARRASRSPNCCAGSACSPDMASRFPHEFSGGQRQRICIARALARRAAADRRRRSRSRRSTSRSRRRSINLMLDLQARMRLAYLFISHDMAVVERVSHRVAVMYLGEIVEIGPRERDLRQPAAPLYQAPAGRRADARSGAARRRRRRVSNDEIKSPIRRARLRAAGAPVPRGLARPCRHDLGRGMGRPSGQRNYRYDRLMTVTTPPAGPSPR